MLWAILGDYGSGKTLFEVIQAYEEFKKGEREVLGNFYLNLPNYRIVDPIELNNFGYDKLILLDEMATWVDARVSMSLRNRYLTNIFNQSRKRTVDVMGTWHLFTDIDIRYRAQVHRIVKCQRFPNGNPKKDKWDFDYQIMNTFNGNTRKYKLSYENAKSYFKLWDTYEILEPLEKERMEDSIRRETNPKDYLKLINKIAKEIKGSMKKITYATVQLAMLERGYDATDHRLVYAKLINMKENHGKKRKNKKN